MSSRVRALSAFLFSDLIGSVVRFPFWWYTEGLMNVVHWLGRSLAYRWRSHAIPLWIHHFFVPMYGAHDWASRLISVVMRAVVILARLIAFIVESIVYLFFLAAWLCRPIASLLMVQTASLLSTAR